MRRPRHRAAVLAAALWLPSVPAATITYTYDAGGRLESLAVDTTGEVIRYRSDPAGNLESVERGGSAELSVGGQAVPPTVSLGEPTAFFVRVENAGLLPAPDVATAFAFDGPARVALLVSAAGTCDVAGLACELGTVDGQAAVNVAVVLVPREAGEWSLGASALSAGAGGVSAVLPLTVTGSGDPADLDGDGLPDAWETENGLDARFALDALEDPDHDGATSLEEFRAGTNPRFNPAVLATVGDLVLAPGPSPGRDAVRAAWAAVDGLILMQ